MDCAERKRHGVQNWQLGGVFGEHAASRVYSLFPYGMSFTQLTAIAMGMVMVSDCSLIDFLTLLTMLSSPTQSIYQNDPQHLSGFVRRILYQFIGPN